MIYVLIVAIFAMGGSGGFGFTQEFNDKPSCEAAVDKLVNTNMWRTAAKASAFCVPKGQSN